MKKSGQKAMETYLEKQATDELGCEGPLMKFIIEE